MIRSLFAVLLTCIVLFGGLSAASAQDEPDCDNATTQFDLNFCADQDYQAADRKLNIAYKTAMAAMKEMDKNLEEADPDNVGAVEALKKAQRAWIDYRDGQCDLTGFAMRGGSGEAMLVSGCLADLTRKRTEELKTLTEASDN